MLPSWRRRLGEARRALRDGQLDRACAIVGENDLKDFRQARELSAELVQHVAERARGRIEAGHSTAGWRDVELAQRLAGSEQPVADVRQAHRQQLLDRAERFLADGRLAAGEQELKKLVLRQLNDGPSGQLLEIVQQLVQAEQMLAAGKSAAAGRVLQSQRTPLNRLTDTIDVQVVAQRIEQLEQECQQHQQLASELHAATTAGDWHQVLELADRLLAVSPRDRVATAARKKAWRAVGLDATQLYHAAGRPVASLALRETTDLKQHSTSSPASHDTMPGSDPPNRFMLWVDAVGGFLVCLDDEIVLGQPTPGSNIAVPLCADLSRRHAVLRREGGNYTLDPLSDVKLDGRPLTGPAVLSNQHTIELGGTVRLEFTKPHALSATARLTPASGHRTEPRADAVLLMADSCVLGPKSHSHVICRRWPGDIMLFRQVGRLCCRSNLSLTIDGVVAEGVTPVEPGARLEGEEFALSLEET